MNEVTDATDATVPSEARWRAEIAAQARSGQTVRDYCAARGFKTATFYEWRRRLAVPVRPAFVPVNVARPPAPARVEGTGVELVLASGHRLRLSRGFDQEVLRAAVSALAGLRPC